MGLSYSDAKKKLSSMSIHVGIGYYLQDDVKKQEDFLVVVPDRGAFEEEDIYVEAMEIAEKKAEEQFQAYKAIENKKVEIILRMPKLDEVLSLAKDEKVLPKDINLDFTNKDVLATTLDYLATTTQNSETMKKSLGLFRACITDSTFEPDEKGKKPTPAELMELVTMNQAISQDAIQQFLDQSMGK